MKLLPFTDYSLDDIIFEGRHQAYGAYALRKAYPQHVVKATTYMFAAVSIFLAAVHVGLALKPDPLPARPKVQVIDMVTVIPPKIEEQLIEKPVTKPISPEVAPAPTKRLVSTRVVPDETPVQNTMPDQADFTNAVPGLEASLGEPAAAGNVTGTESSAVGSPATAVPTASVKDFVEQMPEFPGGLKQMYDYIRRTLRYPSEAQRLGLEGTVIVTFVVGKTGEISDIQVIKDVGGGTAEEAVRVIRTMQPWQPGRQNGQAVPVRFTLPLRFSLAS